MSINGADGASSAYSGAHFKLTLQKSGSRTSRFKETPDLSKSMKKRRSSFKKTEKEAVVVDNENLFTDSEEDLQREDLFTPSDD
jgi:hypothetical protein